ncbi:hypothetical protein SOVF_140220 [Spinacia oleracea]|nr:hypothetical protein SOVF_140220 [Spinacia oleracea]
MKKRLEKEVEVTWWKDTAKHISKQVPESSRALSILCKRMAWILDIMS